MRLRTLPKVPRWVSRRQYTDQALPEDLASGRITPLASPADGAWQGRVIWKELQIVAAAAGAAMHEAGRRANAPRGFCNARSQDHKQARSGFFGEKL